MTYVYILSSYEEHGAEDVVATLDRNRLPEMLVASFRVEEEIPALAALLEREDESILGCHDLSAGWGGIQLHVVKLQ